MAVAADILWAAVAAYAIWRWAAVADRWLDRTHPTLPLAPEDTKVPEDLVALAMTESETWAQEELLKAMKEKYDLYGDWNRVRLAFGVGAWAGESA